MVVPLHVALVEAVTLQEGGGVSGPQPPPPPPTAGLAEGCPGPYLPLLLLYHLGAVGSLVGLRVARAHQVPGREPLWCLGPRLPPQKQLLAWWSGRARQLDAKGMGMPGAAGRASTHLFFLKCRVKLCPWVPRTKLTLSGYRS